MRHITLLEIERSSDASASAPMRRIRMGVYRGWRAHTPGLSAFAKIRRRGEVNPARRSVRIAPRPGAPEVFDEITSANGGAPQR